MIRAGLLSVAIHLAVIGMVVSVVRASPWYLRRQELAGVIYVTQVPPMEEDFKGEGEALSSTVKMVLEKSQIAKVRRGVTQKKSSGGFLRIEATEFLSDVENEAPSYPSEALRRGWEGEVRLQIEFFDSEAPPKVALIGSSGFDILDGEALRAARKWKLPPHLDSAEAHRFEIPLEFRIID